LYQNAQDYDAAVAQFRLAAAQHYDLAQNYLGLMICNGLCGVAQDHVEALRWFKLAAAQGLGAALNNVGKYHEYGLTVAADVAEAIRWYKRAAAAGSHDAADALKRLGA
jgi:TPR repeat protein